MHDARTRRHTLRLNSPLKMAGGIESKWWGPAESTPEGRVHPKEAGRVHPRGPIPPQGESELNTLVTKWSENFPPPEPAGHFGRESKISPTLTPIHKDMSWVLGSPVQGQAFTELDATGATGGSTTAKAIPAAGEGAVRQVRLPEWE